MSTQIDTSIPSWLETPPLSQVNPPVETRKQELPFGELSWEDFERLCLRMARLEANVEHCQLYGIRGQKQEGIDIYARKKFADKYWVYQCKRVNDFGPTKIRNAVLKFLEGEWVGKTDTFILCTKESLVPTDRAEELESQQALLKEKGITVVSWDSHQLSIKLKDLPKLVDDFFGRAWVSAFCGEVQAKELKNRLEIKDVIDFRKKCATFYRNVFNTFDPGLPITATSELNVLPLEERYVIPDIYERRLITPPYSEGRPETEKYEDKLGSSQFENEAFESSRQKIIVPRSTSTYQKRQSVEKWLSIAKHNIILGGPGSGKSTLLRFIAIDLLHESPRLTLLSQKWGIFLPVWVPFALWTKLISNQTTPTCSLSELVHNWLKNWNEERLWPLFEQALEDERLLLLVDGLDEWTNESAAKIALDQLKVFIKQRDVPAIITSRPHGFDRLGMQEIGWKLGELSDFSEEQQKQLSKIWFIYRIKNLNQSSTIEESEVIRQADAESEVFFDELQMSPDLRELSKIPLLLCLLIYHRFNNASLPQSRFKAYESLIEHLISTHPQRRRRAASLTTDSIELNDDDIKKIFGLLAYQIQEKFGEGSIDQNEAIIIVEKFIKDDDFGLGFEQREAYQFTRKILEVGENFIGILVKRSPKDVGFFHRVFQEYLSAYHLSRLPLAEQLSIVEMHCASPQWRQIILVLFYITKRAEDTKQFIECIRKKRRIVNPIDCYTIDLLLCETAFGEFNCPVGIVRELARESFEQVELGSWMPQRELLLKQILNGLRSIKVKELVKLKLKNWFPCRARWREGIFSAMAKWPRDAEVIECLWKGIHDEESDNKRAAASAIADLAASDSEIGNRISWIAQNAVESKTRAAAIEALLRGWPNHENIEHILEVARRSMSPELRLLAILGRIQRNCQTEEDWKELIHIGSWSTNLDYQWKNDVASALMRGWPNSSETKKACFDALKEAGRDKINLDREYALRILLDDYAQDEEVAEFCINQIKNEKYPFISMHYHDPWSLLAKNFKDHPRIIMAIEEWLPKQEFHEPAVAMAALVGRTPKAKQKLLSSLNSSIPHWPAGALIEGWGMQDIEVADRLTKFAFGSASEASRIGHLLPQIIENKSICRSRLIELLRDPECARHDFVMIGLQTLGNTQGDTEVVDIVLSILSDLKGLQRDTIIARLIACYSSDLRVKDFAKQEVLKRDGSYAAVAWTFGNDEELRKKIIEIACPLPTQLRGVIVAYLKDKSVDDTFAMSLLRLYDYEPDKEIKTQASISYHMRLKALNQDMKSAIEYLSQSIGCYGFDHEERQQAAFCGLAILGRLDVMINFEEAIGKSEPCAISIINSLSPNVPLLRYILQNWDDIKVAFGKELWKMLNKPNYDILNLWDELCQFADEYPSPRNEMLHFLESRNEQNAKPNILRFLSRVRPKSPILLEYCLKILCIGDHRNDFSWNESVVAAELISKNFGGDCDVLTHLMSGSPKDHADEKLILTLCEGWPESEELNSIFEIVTRQKRPLSFATYFQLICRKSSSEFIFKALLKLLSNYERIHRNYSQLITRPILRRLQADDNFSAMLIKHLQNNSNPSEKATFPKLIGASRGMPSELRIWCIEEANRQVSDSECPEVGFDLVVGELRPVIFSLMDAINQQSWVE